jgi:hypothetical protein
MNPLEPLIFLGGLALLLLVVYFSFKVRLPHVKPHRYIKLPYPPPRVHLVPVEEIPWSNPERVAAKARQLILLGYEEVGCFEYGERPGHFVWAFVHDGHCLTALLEMIVENDFLELVSFYADGTVWDFCDHPLYAWNKPMEGWTRCPASGLEPKAIHERMLAERRAGPLLPATAQGFVANYEEQYARIVDALNRRGGYEEEEIRALCKRKGLDVTDEMVAECRERIAQQALRGLEAAVIEQYLEQAGLSDEEANEQVNRLFIVHDRLTAQAVLAAFKYRKLWNPDILHEPMPADITPRQRFTWLNERFPGNKYRLLNTVAGPLTADVYLWPEAD